MSTNFANAVQSATPRPEVRYAIHYLYQSLQSQIDQRKPICQSSGRCCHFEEFGHRLFITTAEMATFLHNLTFNPPANDIKSLSITTKSLRLRLAPSQRDGPDDSETHRVATGLNGCPYQIEGLCSVHPIRPFGCRIFFCDATSTQWQHEQYEIFHAELKQIHKHLAVPYFYMEWRAALAEIGLS